MTAAVVVLIFCAAEILIAMYKSGHFFKSLFTTAIQGLASLAAVNVTGLLTGVSLSLNWYTILTVSLFGLPSTIALTMLKFIFR